MKMRLKKLVAIGLVAAMTITTLAGCSKSDSETKTKDGKVKLRFSTWDDAEELDNQQARVDKFNES